MALGVTTTDLRQYLDQLPELAAQRITVTGAPTGGSYTLSYAGATSAAIAPAATAAAVQAALAPLVSTAADAEPLLVSGPAGGPYLVAWRPRSAGRASAIALGVSSLTGGTSPSVLVEPALDAVLADILARAEAVVEAALLPVAFASWPGASARAVASSLARSRYLRLPAYQAGSVTAVLQVDGPAETTGDAVTGWVEEAGALVLAEGWPANAWYRVTATWGYGPATADAQELCLELAVNIWRSRDRGLFAQAQGVEGSGELRYIGGLNTMQRQIVAGIQRRFTRGHL